MQPLFDIPTASTQRLPSPTPEQAAILRSTGETVLINARAGTGKTITLRLLADRFRGQRILYVVYNRRARQEAEKVFPKDVAVRTVHSLAYASTRHGFAWKLGKSAGLSVNELLPRFSGASAKRQVLAALASRYLEYFLNSTHEQIDDGLESFAETYLSDEAQSDAVKHRERILEVCRGLLSDWLQGKIACPHDFYLKLSGKDGRLAKTLSPYDVLLVDEAQDLSPVMLEALRTCGKRLFLVGDSHQQIYEFRYAVDAMRSLAYDEAFDLSMSFRFGEPIAKVASRFIERVKGEPGFRVRGNPERTSRVLISDAIPSMEPGEGWAVLARSNLGLFDAAVRLRERGTPFAFAKDIRSMLMRALDVFWLSAGEYDRIRDGFVESFCSFSEFKAYAEETEDIAGKQLARIIEQHRDEMPGLVFDLLKETKPGSPREPEKPVLLATVHAAKGQEFPRVILHEDMGHTVHRALADESDRVAEEANIAYVGMTRAIERLQVPVSMTHAVPLPWDQLAERPAQPPRRVVLPSREIGVRRRPVRVAAQLAVGGRVNTSYGTGQILEADETGKKFLVGLDRGPAKMWMSTSQLKALD